MKDEIKELFEETFSTRDKETGPEDPVQYGCSFIVFLSEGTGNGSKWIRFSSVPKKIRSRSKKGTDPCIPINRVQMYLLLKKLDPRNL